MKLYYAPGACSLADHIALLEAGQHFETESVDIRTKQTATGADFRSINPKGYVPALVLDNGEVLTENVAILQWIAQQSPALRPDDAVSATRELEMLAFIATEIHHAFKPLWHGGSDDEKQKACEVVAGLFDFAAAQLRGDYLFGDRLSVADCYLFVTLRWAEKFGIRVPEALLRLQWRMEARPLVGAAIAQEESSLQNRGAAMSRGVRENSEQHRFERPIHDTAIAAAYYRLADGRVAFTHTEVPAEFSGLGIATALARGSFDLLRASGRKAILICPFMLHFFAKYPEYADVVDG